MSLSEMISRIVRGLVRPAPDAPPERDTRGIVDARWLGLSKHRYRRPKPPNRKLQRKRAQLALTRRSA